MKQKKRPRRSTVEPKAWWQRVKAGERLPHGMFDAKSKCDAVRCPLPPFHTVTACASTSKRSCHASLAAVARCARVADKLTLRTQKSERPPSVEALEGSFSHCLNYLALVFERRRGSGDGESRSNRPAYRTVLWQTEDRSDGDHKPADLLLLSVGVAQTLVGIVPATSDWQK